MNSLLPQRRHLSTATLCLLITAGGAANIAPAQTMEEVVVTANHREQPAAEIPLSLQVLAFDEIAASAALNGAEDITEYLNGVQTAVANGTQVVFQIRGIGAVDHQALTPGSAAVYSDGVFLATNVQTSALLYDLDR
ncbi:MAG: TonB-dependent receptor, partial [Halieaceae bacterium]|nr:TonB-dependent receptor [Halieaceae bacterium]